MPLDNLTLPIIEYREIKVLELVLPDRESTLLIPTSSNIESPLSLLGTIPEPELERALASTIPDVSRPDLSSILKTKRLRRTKLLSNPVTDLTTKDKIPAILEKRRP